jgi:transposase-like protein
MLSIAVSQERLEADLAAGALACPDCGGRLSPWGFARSREVRMLDGVRTVKPRRACCSGCDATHVLAPSWSVPRRRDGAEVIGEALRLAAGGQGHRRIARQLDRPPGTVRGWLRAARTRAGSLRACAARWAYAVDPAALSAVTPAGSELGDALEAIMLAVRAWVLRFGRQTGPWERAVWLTGGLLSGRLPLPP